MLVGDLIMAVREALTDLPPSLGPNQIESAIPVQTVSTMLDPGTFFAVLTVFNQWGESLPSPEITFTITAPNNNVQITWGALAPIYLYSKVRLYIGGIPGGEALAYETTNLSGLNVFTLDAPLFLATPPTRATAYMPDQDGDSVSAGTMFRWINDALKLGSTVCGGLLDYSGVGSIAGNPQYIVSSLWKKIASMWYDGYPLAMDDNGNYFRRNTITASVLSSVAISTFNNQMMFELWPQPARTAAQTTLASQMFINQTTAQVVDASNFLLSIGFVQIGQEIMGYNGLVGNTLTNLQRALGGTAQSVIGAGFPVQELNLFWSGWRMYQPNFQPGSSAVTVPVPVGWESILFEYGVGRMKLAEQNVGDYSKLTESCKKNFSDWLRQNKVVVGPRQIGDQTSGLETLPNLGGGWVIPNIIIFSMLPKRFDSHTTFLYALLAGGLLWTNRNSFMPFVTRARRRFATWVNRLTRIEGAKDICLKDMKGASTIEPKKRGLKNFANRIFAPMLRFLKNAHCKIGAIGKPAGLKDYERKEVPCSIYLVVEKELDSRMAECNPRKPETNLERLTENSF